jgi:restriction system protein
MARRGFIRAMNAIAREAARAQRQAEAERKRFAREHLRTVRKAEREAQHRQKFQAKEARQLYLERQIEEVDDCNSSLEARLLELDDILEHTLSVNDMIAFSDLRIHEEYPRFSPTSALTSPPPMPQRERFLASIQPPGIVSRWFPWVKARHRRALEEAMLHYEQAVETHEASEAERRAKLNEAERAYEEAQQTFLLKKQQRNQEVNELEAAYRSGDPSTVMTYNVMVLERSEYPEGFPQQFHLAYVPESKELVIEYELPLPEIIPAAVEYRYVKARDVIEERLRKPADIRERYQDLVAALALRTIHEVFEADQGNHLEIVVFNGYVQTVDPATGRAIRPYLISVRTIKDRFISLDLGRIDKRACLRNLGAQVSPRPNEMQAVKPIVEFAMVDRRFIAQGDMLASLDARPNLMDLTPAEFENLVSNLFEKMELEAKLTRSSRDGGVDVVAFDTRPILGGKVVIQAKRYRNTVGVSAVRDLYGTMMNEGANKGILVTTSGYGPDAFDFAKDKPIELIDGGGLLYLLDQVGVHARIIFPHES